MFSAPCNLSALVVVSVAVIVTEVALPKLPLVSVTAVLPALVRVTLPLLLFTAAYATSPVEFVRVVVNTIELGERVPLVLVKNCSPESVTPKADIGAIVVALAGPTSAEYNSFTLFCPPEVRVTTLPDLIQ